jgi:hypothetical protein
MEIFTAIFSQVFKMIGRAGNFKWYPLLMSRRHIIFASDLDLVVHTLERSRFRRPSASEYY